MNLLFLGSIGGGEWIIVLLFILPIVALWQIFEKAGQPGWSILIPIYGIYIMTKVAKQPGFWTFLCLIPGIGYIFFVLLNIEMAKAFNKSTGFGLGMAFLPMIFWPILGFGDAKYGSKDSDWDSQIDNIGR